jgi:hypothetical protein
MRNKLHITESEMKRILSLHKDKINQERQTLKEYDDPGQSTGRIMAGAGGGAALGAGIGSVVPIVGTALGAVIGAGVGALTGWMTTSGGYANRTFQLFKYCNVHKKNLGKPINSDDRLRDIADNIRAAVGGVGTDEVLIAQNLRKLKSIPDLCKLNDIYAKRYTERLFKALDGDIDMDDDWRDFVWKPLSELADKTKKIDNTKLKENAKKCGWGTDIDGYRDSGWRCPKGKKIIPPIDPGPDPAPIPGGGGYEIDYQKIMDAIKQKCVSPGGGGNDDFSLDWNAVGSDQKIDRTMSNDSINKLFND